MRTNSGTSKADLPMIRRLEAVGFRAWPAQTVRYDGSWLLRLTDGYDSKRLNSVNPLDPSDFGHIEMRLEKAAALFARHNRPLTVRQTPLTAPQLIAHMDAHGWSAFSESIVMMADIPPNDTTESIEHLPFGDVGRFVDARILICEEDAGAKAGLVSVIQSVRPESGMFLFESPGDGPTATSLVVQDNDLAGILQVAVAKAHRGQGIGSAIVNACLRWARLRGADKAWLAVESDNAAAIALYRTFGFKDVYRYVYRRRES